MKKIPENQIDKSMSVSNPSALDLRGRQSVRITFRLSEACIDAVSILSAQLGIKQKSIFDHLMEDAQVLKNMRSERNCQLKYQIISKSVRRCYLKQRRR